MKDSPPALTELLPGVAGPATVQPQPVYRPHEDVQRARRRAVTRGVIDAAILLAIDVFVFVWSDARLPFVSRANTLIVLAVIHVGVVCYWYASRKMPIWKARRIAATWSSDERARFRK